MENAPLASVVTPVLLFFIATVAFAAGSPFSSVTVPFTWMSWACAILLTSAKHKNSEKFLKKRTDNSLKEVRLPPEVKILDLFIIAVFLSLVSQPIEPNTREIKNRLLQTHPGSTATFKISHSCILSAIVCIDFNKFIC